jgi:hypothetical protein
MTPTKLQQQNADGLLLAGTDKHYPGNASLTFGGATHTTTEIKQALNDRMSARKNTDAAKAAYDAAVKAERDTRARTGKLVLQYKGFLLVTNGEDVTALADYGLKPRKQAVVKPATRVAAAAKAKETRKARGTKGKRQRLAIKAAATEPTAATPVAPAPAPKA